MIPHRLWNYSQQPAYFETYYGDLLYGTIFEPSPHENRFWIVPRDNWAEIQSLERHKQHDLFYNGLGWEICDERVITNAYHHEDLKNCFYDYQFKPVFTSGQRFKRLYIFGAGASAFCVTKNKLGEFRDSPYCPPTGLELFKEKFDKIIRKYPGAFNLLSTFELGDHSIEAILEDQWQGYRSRYNPRLAQAHINIQFYMQELFQAISEKVATEYTRYSLINHLVSHIEMHREAGEIPVFLSFNYDTILDECIERIFRIRFRDNLDYINWHKHPVALFKPHGSCNWGWPVQHQQFSQLGSARLADVLYKKQIMPNDLFFRIVAPMEEGIAYNTWGIERLANENRLGKFVLNKSDIQVMQPESDQTHYPALLLPYRDKDEFVMPYEHHTALNTVLNQINELVLIGWKASEAQFNRKLLEQGKKIERIVIVNPNPLEVTTNLVKSGFILSNYDIDEAGDFETYIRANHHS